MSRSSSSQTPASSSQFESVISAALNEFKEETGKNLLDNWLAKELQNCDSVEAVMDIIKGQAEAFNKFKNGGSKLMKWIRSSVHVLYTISAALGDGVGVAVPSAKAVFTGIGILLAAAKDVRASHDALVDLFERIQFFLKRLGVHTRISPTEDMLEILVKIMAEVIVILSIATKEMQQSKTKTYLKKLLGRTDIEDALKKLDSLTQEEVRMAIAQVLQGIKLLKDDAKKVEEALREIKWNQIEQDVRRWFSPPDPSVNYNTACESHQEGTAAWFFQGSIFKEWELVGTLLWVHGKPGSGKSILSSAIIKHVISLRDAGDACIAYFFFDFRDKEKKQDPRNFLTSLLIQLSAHSDPCRKIIFDIYSKHGKGTQQPSIGNLTKCLHDMLFVATQRPVYLIIDALDECPDISGIPTPRAVLLGLLKGLVDLRIPNLHICVTSRPEVDIKIVLEPLAYSTVSLHAESGQKQDISDYVNTVVNSDGKMRKWRDEEKKLVVEGLSNKAEGMFRWVFCQLEVLRHCLPASIRQTLHQLPESLDETYAHVLKQIPQPNQAHAHRLLQCLTVAIRPLRVEELAELLAFEFDIAQGAIPRYRAGWRSNDQEQAVLSTCSSLISIVDDNGSQVVQFSHFSVKEFLMSDRLTSSLGNFSQYQINPGPAHTILAQACLGVLLHLNDHTDELSIKSSPLAQYAAQHWITHAQFEDVASRVKDGMEALFDCDKPHFAAWVGIYDIDQTRTWIRPWTRTRTRQKLPTPIYYSSLCGFSNLVEHLAIKYPQHLNAVGGTYNSPLLAALVERHVGVAEILLKRGANVNTGMRGRKRMPRITTTIISVVQFLLSHGADVNYRQEDDLHTPLHLAVRDGELEEARVLLEHKADVNSRDNRRKTPFQLLFEDNVGLLFKSDILFKNDNFFGLAQLLLEHGADVNTRDEDHNTPLHLAMAMGERGSSRAKALLEFGADASAENYAGKTPLHELFGSSGSTEKYASDTKLHRLLGGDGSADRRYDNKPELEGHILDTLVSSLKHGANVNIGANKWTLLHDAASKGWLNIAEVLIDHGAHVNARTDQGITPLHLASRDLHPAQRDQSGVARLLLSRGADVNAVDGGHNTPLHSATSKGQLNTAQMLLDHDADADAENDEGETPLNLVSRGEYNSQEDGVRIARLLLERGVDVDTPNKNKWTPLHSAAFKGRLEIAQMLLNYGANADAENDQGETPLNLVSRGEYNSQEDGVGIARLLLERGVDVDTPNKNKWTPLHSAAFRGRLEIAQMLLNHGANADAENDEEETPLNLVSRGEYNSQEDGVGIARLLLGNGVGVNARNKNKWTPLHSAAFKGRLEIAQMLLNHGANSGAENDEGETPLNLVSRGEYNPQEDGAGIARLLLGRGEDVEAQNKNKNTPLHSASFSGRYKVARVLLDHGANADAENDEGETPLNLVSRGEYKSQEDGVGLTRLLLEHGGDIDTWNKNKWTPLHSAAFKGRFKIVKALLSHSANVDAENDEGETPLNLVSRGEYDSQEDGVGTAQLLLEHGVDVNARSKNKTTSLHSAAFRGRFKIASLLLDHGAHADVENDQGETPLHLVSRGEYAAQEDGVGIAKLLLDCGVNVNARNKNKATPLHLAAFNGSLKVASMLVDYDANTTAEDDQGETPLHLVSRGEYGSDKDGVGIARLLLGNGADLDARNRKKTTPLHTAAFKGKFKIVQVLLNYGANADAENDEGETPLNLVSRGEYDSQEGSVDTAQLLLEHGVDVNARGKNKATPLHSAAFGGRLKIASLLLDHGANADAENEQGETPLHLVSQGKYDSPEHVGIARLLLERGVDVNGKKKNKWVPLHSAVFKGRLEIARALLNHGANPNAADEQGETPLHVVSQGKYSSQGDGVSIARLLLERGADVNAPDKDQYTPFYSASYFRRFDIARLLLEHGAKDAERASRGTKRKTGDEGSRSEEKKPKLHEDMHLVPWRHVDFTNLNA